MDAVMIATEIEERLVVEGDLNGHIGCNRENINKMRGGHSIGEMNEEGELITDFAMAFDMAINNTFFTNDDNVTYSSVRRQTQIDFLMCRRNHLTDMKNCKVIKGDRVSKQHRLVVLDLLLRRVGMGKKVVQPKIKWGRSEKQEIREFSGSIS
ncbi:craniofacial development protein 2-like [Palaemon carinicauda]|uniref:craniofacial development protein 2-like n=1 Tax=Palaemon carinicauda TaxID=392227 RepID=UPI0035B58D48